jgi:hypothetical protein
MAVSVSLKVPFTHQWNNRVFQDSILKISTIAELIRSTGLKAAPPKDWTEKSLKELDTPSESEEKAFGAVFTHDGNTEAVICFSQSAPAVELFTENMFSLENKLPSWETVDIFVKEVLQGLQEKQVRVVGYSFGGAIAQLVGYHYKLPSVSLDGPGVSAMIEKFHKNHPDTTLDVEQMSSAKTMMVIPHAINQLGMHGCQTIFSCPPPTTTNSINPEHTVRRFVNFVKKALQTLYSDTDDRSPQYDNVCTLAEYTGKFHGLSVFLTGKIDHDEGERMRKLATQMQPKTYSEEQLSSGLKKASLGVSLTVGGMGLKSLSQCTSQAGNVMASVGSTLQDWGTSKSSTAGQGYSGTSVRSVGGSVSGVGTVTKGTGNVVNLVGQSGELISEVAQAGGKLTTKAGLLDAEAAFETKSTPAFLELYSLFLTKIEALLSEEM